MRDRPDIKLAQANEERLRREYPALFDDLSAHLYSIDPMGLNYEINPDEYDSEVGTILPRILETTDAAEIAVVVREEFSRWFGNTTLQRATYDDIAEEMLVILQRYRSGRA